MRENEFQPEVIKELYRMFPDCFVMKNDANYRQGFPDLTVFIGPYYILLECKKSKKEMRDPRPNQDYYVDAVNAMGGFARFIYPENKEAVLNEIRQTFRLGS